MCTLISFLFYYYCYLFIFFLKLQIDPSNKALIENLTLQLSAAAVALHQAQESRGIKPENSAVITGK